jgi:hypothetical protein
MRGNVLERFMAKVDKRGDDECWEWLGYKSAKGYGRFKYEGKDTMATRVAWILIKGLTPPSGLMACHKCDNPSCVNPEHLFWGTAHDNTLDSIQKKRFAKNNLTHCPKGHPYSGNNLYISPDGFRRCRICRKEQKKNSYAHLNKEA